MKGWRLPAPSAKPIKRNIMNYKISDVTKALKKAGFAKLDAEEAIFGNDKTTRSYYKYKGALYIRGERIGFNINNADDSKIFGKYAISAIDANGATSETWTNWACLFFSRLFGYLDGTITETEIIQEVCA